MGNRETAGLDEEQARWQLIRPIHLDDTHRFRYHVRRKPAETPRERSRIILILSRDKRDKRVFIDVPGCDGSQPRRIIVSLEKIFGDKARLGFEADGDILIRREEITEDLPGRDAEDGR